MPEWNYLTFFRGATPSYESPNVQPAKQAAPPDPTSPPTLFPVSVGCLKDPACSHTFRHTKYGSLTPHLQYSDESSRDSQQPNRN